MSDWLKITNKSDNIVEIDIEGTIGGSWFEDGTTKEDLKAELKAIDKLEAEKIIVNIDSLGGYVSHALSIHDLLKSNKANIEVRINGMTASAATIIAMAGDKIKMSDNALFLIHNASGMAYGDKNIMDDVKDDLEKIDNRIANIYQKRNTKEKDNAEILELMNNKNGLGEWWDGEEAKENGFIDEIFEPLKAAAEVKVETLRDLKLPIPKSMIKNDTSDLKAKFETFKTWVNDKINSIKTSDVKLLDDKEVKEKITDFENEVANSETKLNEQKTANDKVITEKDKTIQAFKTKVTEFETELAKLKGNQTDINTDNDPSPAGGKPKLSENEQALEDNAENMRKWDGKN